MTASLPARRRNTTKLPALDDLTDDQWDSVRKAVHIDKLKAELHRRQIAESEDFPSLVAAFLETRRSAQTARRYRNSIRVWVRWCEGAGIEHPLLAEPKDADLFAAQLTGAPASVNSTISAVSSFYSTLSKWGKVARTPFVKVQRRGEASTEHMVPTAAEVRKILEAIT